MALQQNPYSLNTTHNNSKNKRHHNNINTNNMLNKNLTLPLTIIPLKEDALIKKQQQRQLLSDSAPKPPDLTFHCMCCEEYFVNPFHMYEHLNTKHADLPESLESEEDIVDGKDYSWVFEPVCEIMDDNDNDTKGKANEDASSSSSSDSDTDDDSSSTSSSSSSTSSSSSSSNANTNNTHDEATRDALEVKHLIKENATNYAHEMEEAAYEEVEAVSKQSDFPVCNIKLEPLDYSSPPTPVYVLNPVANTTITPVKTAQIRRGRGRRSAAQQAAIEMSSLISGEPKCFQCTHCEASFPSAGDLSKHVRCHITNKPFQCSICDKTFTHIGSLNTHIRIHSGEKPYKCELCSKAFTQSSSLMVHIRSHSIKKPYQCHLCDKGFVNTTSLTIHLKTHNESGTVFTCNECAKSFKQESQLNEHLRMHTLSLVYQCSICRSAFASSSELVQHMKCHMGEKPFTCSICDRAFTQSGSLNIHMRIHTGEKPFNCKFCNKSFTQASSLSVHLKIHSGDKPFPCRICGKSYSQAAYLNKHIQKHMEDRKPKMAMKMEQNETLLCIVCGELHRDANSLAIHVTQKHAALLSNIQGQANNSMNMNISAEERLKQEQMYMQQMQMLMQMQNQMVKQPAVHLMEPIGMMETNGSPMRSLPYKIENKGIPDERIDVAEDEGDSKDYEENDLHEREQFRDIDKSGQSINHSNNGSSEPDGEMLHIKSPEHLQNDKRSYHGPRVLEENIPEICTNINTQHPNEYGKSDHTYENKYGDEDKYKVPLAQKNTNEAHPSYKENGVNFQNINKASQHRGVNETSDAYPDHLSGSREDLTCENRLMSDNSQTMSIYKENSHQGSQSQKHLNEFNERDTSPNRNSYNGMSSPECEQDCDEEIPHYQTSESPSEPVYDNDNGMDMDNTHEDDGSNNCDDIEMSDYPFVDDTKFNFYDDYAAEEEVETAE